MQDLTVLTIPLSCGAVGLCITSLVLPYWSCGGFFSTCIFSFVHIITMGLLLSGLGLFGLVFLADLCKACSNSWIPGPVCNTLKILFALLGAGAMLAGNMLYAVTYVQSWSFVMSFAGSVVAVHVVLISLFSSRCMQGH